MIATDTSARNEALDQESGNSASVRPASGRLKSLMTSRKTQIVLIGLLLLSGCIVKAASGIALLYDGSYQLLLLIDDRSLIAFHQRLGLILPQIPTMVALFLTDEVAPVVVTFCTTYAMIPLVALVLSWLPVRSSQPSLFLWPALAICLTGVCAQTALVNGCMIVCLLAWPLFLGVITPMNRYKPLTLALLALYISLVHISSVIYVSIAAAAALLLFFKRGISVASLSLKADGTRAQIETSELDAGEESDKKSARLLLLTAALLGVMAVVRMILFIVAPAFYDVEAMSREANVDYLTSMFPAGVVLAAVLGVFAGLLLLLRKRYASKALVVASFLCATLSAAISLLWSSMPETWMQGFLFCRLISIFFAPLMLLAFIDSLWRARPEFGRARACMVLSGAVVFFAVCLVQSESWNNLMNFLTSSINSSKSVLIDARRLKTPYPTPLAHWSVSSLSVVLQGASPAKIVLPHAQFEEARRTGVPRISPWDAPERLKRFILPRPGN